MNNHQAMGSNKKKVLRASFFVIFGFGMSQVIRLASNIILTRLLVPEFFGIMAICNVVILGINLFSDIGIAQGIIRSPRGHEPDFVNTAYTLQVIRGGILFILLLIASYPISVFYEQRQILYILPVIGLNTIIQGFISTSLILFSKDLQQGKVNLIELTAQGMTALLTITLAYFLRNVWALVFGTLFTSLIKMVMSHLFKSEVKNQFILEKKAVHELLSFGKWIFLSTMMTFFASQADRLIIGKIFTLSFFGVYNIALMLSDLPKQIIAKISRQVLYPLISKYSDLSRDELRSKMTKQRRIIVYPLALCVSVFACFGDFLILFLYDNRYDAASWILPLLVIGIWPLVLYSTVDMSLLAIGKPKYLALGNFIKFLYMIIFIPLFYRIWGIFGAIIAVVLNDIPVYIVILVSLVRERLSFLKQDLCVTVIFLLLISVFMLLRSFLGLGLPGEAAYYAMGL